MPGFFSGLLLNGGYVSVVYYLADYVEQVFENSSKNAEYFAQLRSFSATEHGMRAKRAPKQAVPQTGEPLKLRMCKMAGCDQPRNGKSKGETPPYVHDPRRGARFSFAGFCSGLMDYMWFNALDAIIPGTTPTAVVIKTFLDNIESFPQYGVTMAVVALLSKQPLKRVMSEDLIPCTLWSWIYWWPLDIIMFTFVPLQWQTVFNMTFDAIYSIAVSYFTHRHLPHPHKHTLHDEGATVDGTETLGKAQ
eukprot:TRINITY_DN9284_c0_g1_i1.p1 TRINITY_DN9284_c0_g1~~TRINITY_DN9284_c0_g1_i1.p1  ORF type:complete len:256 (-),score=35.03 TRINITY_DN9284_c0_g1_i1:49-792(-)